MITKMQVHKKNVHPASSDKLLPKYTNSSVNGGRGPSDELHDVRNVLETKTAGKWVYFL